MRVAIFSDTYLPEVSGVVTSVVNFTTRLAKHGHKFVLFVPRYPNYKDKPNKNIKIHRYFAINLASNRASKVTFPRVVDILIKTKHFKPDVIHVQDPFNLGWVGMLAAKIYNIPLIHTYHTYLPDFMVYLKPSKITGLDRIALKIKDKLNSRTKKLKSFGLVKKLISHKIIKVTTRILNESMPEFPSLAKGICWGYTRAIYNGSELIITPSMTLKKELRKHGVRGRIIVLSNGIDFKDIPKKECYKRKNRIVHSGRLGHEKRIDLVLRAFARVLKNHRQVKLYVYGDGPALPKLRHLSNQLGIIANVEFKGFLERKKLLRVYKNFDFFATASPMETQGLVVLEAMAAGLPVVGFNKLAVPEMVKHNTGGLIAKAFDISEFSSYMEKLIENEKLRETLGRNAVELARKQDVDIVALKLEKIYQSFKK